MANLKNRYLKKEIDAIELNRKTSYYMHDYSGKGKLNIPATATTATAATAITTTVETRVEQYLILTRTFYKVLMEQEYI